MNKNIRSWIVGVAAIFICSAGWAGPVFLTGHDPDFHAQGNAGARNLLTAGLAFVTGGTYVAGNTFSGLSVLGTGKFLWVEGRIGENGVSTLGGHLVGEDGLGAIGLTLGVDYDRANAIDLPGVTLSDYSAIAVASTFGGYFFGPELDAMIARSADIEAFINAGGGLFAASESESHGAHLGGSTPFGYLPIAVTSITANSPFTVTAFGATLGLVNGDMNSPTHNSFGFVGGLNIVDTDSSGNATTLAGNVNISGGVIIPVPEPSTLILLALGLAGFGFKRNRKHS